MLKVIGIIVAAVLIAVAVVLVLASTKPDRFHVQRTPSIEAPLDGSIPLIKSALGCIETHPASGRST